MSVMGIYTSLLVERFNIKAQNKCAKKFRLNIANKPQALDGNAIMM